MPGLVSSRRDHPVSAVPCPHCGKPLVFGTDTAGAATTWCPRCHVERPIPRRPPTTQEARRAARPDYFTIGLRRRRAPAAQDSDAGPAWSSVSSAHTQAGPVAVSTILYSM